MKGAVGCLFHAPACKVRTGLHRASLAEKVAIAMWPSVFCAVQRLGPLRAIACCRLTTFFQTLLDCETCITELLAMPCAMRSHAIFRAKICYSSTDRMLTPRAHNSHVAKCGTVLLTMAWFAACRTKCRLLVAPLELTPFAPVVFKSMLLTMRSAKSCPSADLAMCWTFLAPSDLAAPVHNINAALGRVFLAVLSIPTRFAKACPLLTTCIEAMGSASLCPDL